MAANVIRLPADRLASEGAPRRKHPGRAQARPAPALSYGFSGPRVSMRAVAGGSVTGNGGGRTVACLGHRGPRAVWSPSSDRRPERIPGPGARMTRPGGDQSMTMTIGIDISKDWLDVDRFPDAPGGVGKARFANSASGHAALVAWLEELGAPARLVFEATGAYGVLNMKCFCDKDSVPAGVSPMPTEVARSRWSTGRWPAVVADFEGGAITSNAGGLLLGATDRAIGLVERFAACFAIAGRRSGCPRGGDAGRAAGVRHRARLRGPGRHDRLRHDSVLGVVLGRLEARHGRCAPLAGKSTLNRLEHGARKPTATAGSPTTARRSRRCSWTSSSTRTRRRRRRSCSISTPPTTRCTATRRGGSSTATTTATATCRSTCSAAATSWRRSSGAPTSTPRPAPSRRRRASSAGSAPAGRGCGSSFAATAASRGSP